MPNQIFA
ncbi:hypothetical protein D018_0658A, partial [Vibrio parahaemolyticus VP2007-007]